MENRKEMQLALQMVSFLDTELNSALGGCLGPT